jgi:hypothetical protein
MVKLARRWIPALLLGSAACDPGFEDVTEVIDLRPLAMVVEPPEQVLDIDPQRLPSAQELLRQLTPVQICGLVGDPPQRPLRSTFTVCVEGDNTRCDEGRPAIVLPEIVTPDPETSLPRPSLCARLEPSLLLLAVLQSAIDADPLSGFSGIDVLVQWRLQADDEPAVYSGKRLRFAARVPATRTPNHNPTVTQFAVKVTSPDGVEGAVEVPLPLGRCVDQAQPITVSPGSKVQITPIEPEGLRETYVVPTFDGKVREFTETIDYHWYTSAGSFSSSVSGGRRDAFGNLPTLDSSYRTRAAKKVTEPVDAAIWIVQRDERLGEAWFESCVRVEP